MIGGRPREDALDALLSRALAQQALPRSLADDEFAALWDRAEAHSVDLLLAAAVREGSGVPLHVREEATKRLAAAKLVEQLRYAELRGVLGAIAGIDTLLLKGAALAYTLYPEPHLRPRLDLDLFVRADDVAAADRVLAEGGYAPQPPAALADAQRGYARIDHSGLHHYIDLHWGVTSLHPFAAVLPFDSAWASSVPIEALGSTARTLAYPDALLLACVHRVAHHHDSASLLWLWDVHLLAGRLAPAEWGTLVRTARETRMRAVMMRGLDLARSRFGTEVPTAVLEQLLTTDQKEPAARFVGGVRLIEVAAGELGAMRSWSDRLRFVRQNLFPPPSHMRATYNGWPAVLLPLMYLARVVRGGRRWLRRPRGSG